MSFLHLDRSLACAAAELAGSDPQAGAWHAWMEYFLYCLEDEAFCQHNTPAFETELRWLGAALASRLGCGHWNGLIPGEPACALDGKGNAAPDPSTPARPEGESPTPDETTAGRPACSNRSGLAPGARSPGGGSPGKGASDGEALRGLSGRMPRGGKG